LIHEWGVEDDIKITSSPGPVREISLSGDVLDDKRGVLLIDLTTNTTASVIAKQEGMAKRLRKQLAIERQKIDAIERQRRDRVTFMTKLEESINNSIKQLKEEKIFLDQLKEERIFLDQLSYLPPTKQAKFISSDTQRTPEEEQVSRQLQEVNQRMDSLSKSTTKLSQRVTTEQAQLENAGGDQRSRSRIRAKKPQTHRIISSFWKRL